MIKNRGLPLELGWCFSISIFSKLLFFYWSCLFCGCYSTRRFWSGIWATFLWQWEPVFQRATAFISKSLVDIQQENSPLCKMQLNRDFWRWTVSLRNDKVMNQCDAETFCGPQTLWLVGLILPICAVASWRSHGFIKEKTESWGVSFPEVGWIKETTSCGSVG